MTKIKNGHIDDRKYYSNPFQEGCNNGELLVQKCNACHKVQFYPRSICKYCWYEELSWIKSSGIGKIESFTIVHRAPSPEFADKLPYVVAFIQMEEGFSLISFINNPSKNMEIGSKVFVKFEKLINVGNMPVFELV